MATQFLTSSKAAEFLKMSKSTFLRRVNQGYILPDLIDPVSHIKKFSPVTLRIYQDKMLGTDTLPFKRSLSVSNGNHFTFIDLFAGIGGIRLGFEAAGGECIFSSEIDKWAVKTYSYMFKDRKEHNPAGDITKIDASDIPAMDIVCGGFPCQPFSIAGVSKYNSLGLLHGFNHPTKGTLFFDILRIISHHKPKAFFLENVKNLKSHNKGNTWKIIQKSLQDMGYDVYAQIFDAKLVLPQHRERIFIVGFRKDLNIKYDFPSITQRNVKIRDILDKGEIDPKYTLTPKLWEYLKNYAIRQKEKGNGFGYGLVDLDGISRTLSARYYKDGSEILIPQENGKRPRRLTPSECARLMGFPEKWGHPVVSDCQAYKQFGNAVAVPLIEEIAKSMVAALQDKLFI